ncbi:hypothetical protein [Amycolatopsis sulphurea]
MTEYMQSLPAGAFPNLLQIGQLFNAGTSRDRLEFTLEAFVAGMRALVRA